jgi:hypothetical protein
VINILKKMCSSLHTSKTVIDIKNGDSGLKDVRAVKISNVQLTTYERNGCRH